MTSEQAVEKTKSQEEIKTKSKLRENIEAIVIAVILALFIRTFIVQAFKIPSGSMKPTLQIGDHILVNKFIYGVKIPYFDKQIIAVSHPNHGDIIVFKYPEDPSKDFIKRVIGLPGDVIEIRDKIVYVNNVPIAHDHGVHRDSRIVSALVNHRDNFGPVVVPENSYFVMGDNRDNSYDSRFWGFVNQRAIKGKAFIIYWSWDSDHFGVRWGRIGEMLK